MDHPWLKKVIRNFLENQVPKIFPNIRPFWATFIRRPWAKFDGKIVKISWIFRLPALFTYGQRHYKPKLVSNFIGKKSRKYLLIRWMNLGSALWGCFAGEKTRKIPKKRKFCHFSQVVGAMCDLLGDEFSQQELEAWVEMVTYMGRALLSGVTNPLEILGIFPNFSVRIRATKHCRAPKTLHKILKNASNLMEVGWWHRRNICTNYFCKFSLFSRINGPNWQKKNVLRLAGIEPGLFSLGSSRSTPLRQAFTLCTCDYFAQPQPEKWKQF